MPRWVAALLLLPTLLSGCTQGDPGSAAPEWTEVVVPGRQMLDLGYSVSSGTDLTWSWQSTHNITFDALYVSGGSFRRMASEYGTSGESQLTAPMSGQYNLTWDNRGLGEVTVRFVVRDGYAQTVWPPGSGPGCAPPPALLARMC